MNRKDTVIEPTRLIPWEFQPRALLREAQDALRCDAAAMGVISASNPQVDEILAQTGCKPRALMEWCDQAADGDALFKTALSRGAARGATSRQGADPPAGDGHAMVIIVPHSLLSGKVWWLCVTRRDNPFESGDESIGEALVLGWQTRLCQRTEPDIQRLLLGRDDRLTACDPWTVRRLTSHPAFLDNFLEQLRAAVPQRWANLEDEQRHDLFLDLDGKTHWVVFHKARCIDVSQAMYWYIEMRPSIDEEMIPLAGVEDPRIAQALAFLHDHYHETPSLAQTAEIVHISPFHFHRLFTREVGISPKHYLQRKQLQVARWLLRTSRMPVGEIASRIGFASHGHFTSTFHRVVGASPTEYREGRGIAVTG